MGFSHSEEQRNGRVLDVLIDEEAGLRLIVSRLGAELVSLARRDSNGALVAANDDWQATQKADIEATGLPPTDDRESAIIATFAPGNYTAIVQSRTGVDGIGLVEVYHLQ